MFTFYHKNTDTFARWVQDRLEEMVVAHEVIYVEESDPISLPDGLTNSDLPLLSDGHEHWTSREDIKEFLNELQKDLEFSHSLTSDACYVDPENSSKCL